MWKSIQTKYANLRLVHKLVLAFLAVSVVPLLVVQIFAYQVNHEQMQKKINELMVNNLTQIAERTSLNLQIYSNQVYQICQDDQIIEQIQELTDDSNTHRAVSYNRIVNRFKQYGGSNSAIRCICIVCPDGTSVVYDFETDSSINTIWNAYHNIRQIPPYKDAIDAAGMVITDTMRFDEGENQGYFFHISKRLFDFGHLDRGSIGTIIMTVNQSVLNDICNNSDVISENSINFIINEDRSVITYPDADFAGLKLNPDLDLSEFVTVSGFLRNKNIAVNQYKDPVTDWIFCNVYDEDYMLRDLHSMQRMQTCVAIVVLLFATIMIFWTVRGFDASVKSVVHGMQEVQHGNLDVVVPVQSFREIEIIADNFNDMTVKVKHLIEEVGEAKEQQKNAEIRALEAQINPHFLYNTLDSINWMAIEKEEYEISKMVRNLGVILRYSIDKSNQEVTIREAADWLGKYISLQQMRFNDAFSYNIHVDEGVYTVKIYKLLLQPFLENAIIHGFRDTEYGGLLRVDIDLTEDRHGIVIIIEDNGHGMPQDKVNIFNNRETAIRDDGRSIGLHNTFARIDMYYGGVASWQISSIIDMGTVVTIRLPADKEGNHK